MNNSIKIILFGISLMLLGIYIQGDLENNWYETELLFVIVGFITVIIGLFWNPIKKIIDK